MFDIVQGIQQVRVHLTEHGMRARGADGTDFQFEGDRSLCFRTGTSHGEVSVIPVIAEVAGPAIRIHSAEQLVEAKYTIDQYIEDWRNRDATSILRERLRGEWAC